MDGGHGMLVHGPPAHAVIARRGGTGGPSWPEPGRYVFHRDAVVSWMRRARSSKRRVPRHRARDPDHPKMPGGPR